MPAARILPDITLIATFHNEGRLAYTTLKSLERCRANAELHGLFVEAIYICDNVDETTFKFIKEFARNTDNEKIERVRFGDLSCSRNRGISIARGRYIAICDGDDLYSENWLAASYFFCESSSTQMLVHPAITISFGALQGYTHTIDQLSNQFDADNLLMTNFWCSCVFGLKQHFIAYPYRQMRSDGKSSGFGYEDWHWNCETVAAGLIHRPTPETALFYRRKAGSSLNALQQQENATIPPTTFFA